MQALKRVDVVIISEGIIGEFNDQELSNYKLKIILVEKEDDIVIEKGNFGIIHAGYNVDFNTLKGKLNIKSVTRFNKLCHDLKGPFKRIDILVTGFSEKDLKKIKELKENKEKDSLKNLKII